MKNGEHTTRMRYPRLWRAIAMLIVVVLGVYLLTLAVNGIFPEGNNTNKTGITPPSLKNQKVTPTPRETARELFKPWHLKVNGGTGAPYLVMLYPGDAVEVSATVVRSDNTWQAASPVQIQAVEEKAHVVTINMGNNNDYTLSYNQAFVLSEEPENVYIFQKTDSGKAGLLTTTVEALKAQR